MKTKAAKTITEERHVTMKLPDGRVINETKRQNTLKEISKMGVCGHHVPLLLSIFDAKENECQVALNITRVTWNKLCNTIGEIHDPSLAMLIKLMLTHPEEWPVRYRPDPDIAKIEEFFDGSTNISMLTGRSSHAIYRWRLKLPKDHMKIVLLIIQESIDKIKGRRKDRKAAEQGEARLNEFIEIAEAEAARRNVNIRKDRSWGAKE